MSTERRAGTLATLVGAIAVHAAAAGDSVFFENTIRPLLERACVKCHDGPSPSGDLRLTDRAGWVDAGVIEPGRPEASRLLEVIRSADPEERMPPPESGLAVTADEIRGVEKWIADGAFDPRRACRRTPAPAAGGMRSSRSAPIRSRRSCRSRNPRDAALPSPPGSPARGPGSQPGNGRDAGDVRHQRAQAR